MHSRSPAMADAGKLNPHAITMPVGFGPNNIDREFGEKQNFSMKTFGELSGDLPSRDWSK
jgi:hypothetical protein